jgi:colicin import membrane protein
MATADPSPTISLRERSYALVGREERLPKWVLASLIAHAVIFTVALILSRVVPQRQIFTVPVYTVDLIGGDRIGRANLGTELTAPGRGTSKSTEKALAEPQPIKVAKEKSEKTEKPKPAEKKIAADDKLVLKEKGKIEPVKTATKKEATKEPQKEETQSETTADSVRERLMKSAAERAGSRADSATKGSGSSTKGEQISAGTGQGEGAAALGPGGRGGPGVVKGLDYMIYQNRLISTIRNNWVWVGPRGKIKVVVQFNIKDNGEITGLKIVQSSGNASYDDSVLRAVRKSSPLPPLTESIRSGFSEVELAFRPEDLEA